MRHSVSYDNQDQSWEVLCSRSAQQTVGWHRQQMSTIEQPEADERH